MMGEQAVVQEALPLRYKLLASLLRHYLLIAVSAFLQS